MKKLLILLTGVAIFIINVSYGNDCTTNPNPLHTHDTTNVGHQFYDALVETPKDALVKGGVATKDFAVATAELLVETPLKTLTAIKNGALKALIATKNGITKGYQIMVKKLLLIAKETTIEMGHRIKSAGHTLAHGDDHEEHEKLDDIVATYDDMYVLIIETPRMDCPQDATKNNTKETRVNTCLNIVVVAPELVQSILNEKGLELLPLSSNSDTQLSLDSGLILSEKSLFLLSQSSHCIAADLLIA